MSLSSRVCFPRTIYLIIEIHETSFCSSVFSVIIQSKRQMGNNSCFSRTWWVSTPQVILLCRLENKQIYHVKLFVAMSFERSVTLHSAGDDPEPSYLSTQTVYPP